MALTEDLQELKTRAAALERRRAQREAQLEAAERYRDEALETLKTEYGVETLEAARVLADSLDREVADAVADAREKLEEIE